ncbi:MAG: amino acid ABC transporter permease, partial [Mesorhizobium sp.]
MGPIGEDQFLFLMQGLKWTVLLAIVGFIGGGIFGILIALLRTSKNKVARTITAGYIGVFQGTPLLMQLFVVYYGVALLGIDVNAWIAVAVAFTL